MTPDLGKMSRQLGAQSVNTVVAFSVVSPEIRQAIESIKYIAENMRSRNKAREVSIPGTFCVTVQPKYGSKFVLEMFRHKEAGNYFKP